MPTPINGQSDLQSLLRRSRTWRVLFAWQAMIIDSVTAARMLDLSPNDAEWLRAEAFDSARKESSTWEGYE